MTEKLTLAQRLDPARVRELEQQVATLSAVIVAGAKDSVRALNNTLTALLNAAEQGDPESKQALAVLRDRLQRVTALAAGIHLPAGATLPGESPPNGKPN